MTNLHRNSANQASVETISYLSNLKNIHSLSALQSTLSEVTRAIGFDVYVLGQFPRKGYARTEFRISSYSQYWIDEVYPNFRYKADPVLDALLDADAPFLWEDLEAYRQPTPAQAEYLASAASYGYLRGYTVPIRIPGEPIGVASFATKSNGPVPIDMLPFAQQIATLSFKRAHSIVAQIMGRRQAAYGLTQCEMECLRALVQGKSNYVIGRIYQMSDSDLRETVSSIQRKPGTKNRVSLAVKAIQTGLCTFNEALIE